MSPGYNIIHSRFNDCIRSSARIERLYDGCRWAEGPAWFAAGRYLDRVIRRDSGWRFGRKLVILDSRRIDTLLAIPL